MASFLKKIGKGVSHVGKEVGKVATKAAPIVGLIPGVGTVAGATIGGLGSVLAGHNLKSDLKYGLEGGASGLVNSKLLGGGGLRTIASKVSGLLTPPGGSPGGSTSLPTDGSGAVTTGGGAAAGGIGGLLSRLGVSPSTLLQLGITGAGAVSGINSARSSGRAYDAATGRQSAIADELATQGRALNAGQAPLRDAATAGLLARMKAGPRPTTDFTQFADRLNPFAAQFTARQPTATATIAPPTSIPGLLPPPPITDPRKLLLPGRVAA